MSKSTHEPTARRPIKSRNTRWAEAIANHLASLGINPNCISILGMVAALAAGVAFYYTNSASELTQRVLWFCGAALCQLRLLCNLFDGMVAIKRETASPTGELYNEIPDRVSDAAIFVGLGFASGGNVPLGFITALTSVFVAYVRAMATSVGAPNDFCGPMAKPQRMALATIVAIYLAFSPVSWRLPWGEISLILGLVTVGNIATALRRLVRAGRYLERNKQ